MNTTIHTTNKVCLIAFFLLVTISKLKADQLIWTGSVSKSWEDGDNWSTGKVPTPSDTVTIETGSNDVNLDKPVKVKMFTMSSGLLDMQTYDLMVTSKAVFQSGEILNGNVIVTGTGSATFSGTLFNAKVNVSSGSVFLNGSVFNDSLFITKNGKSNDLSKGGNTFNEAVMLTDSGDGAMVLADSLHDLFKEELIVTNVGEGAIYLAHRSTHNEFYEDVYLNGSNIFSNYYGTAIYSGNIFIDSPDGEIYFGVSEGSCTLNYGKKLSTPLSTISAGKLFLRNFYSLDSLSTIKLDLGGSSQLYLETGTVFHDKVSFTAPSVYLNGATFNDVADFSNTGNSNVTCTGGCTFAKAMTLTKSGGATKIYSLSNTLQDTYYGSTTFENTSGTFSLNCGLFKKKCTLKSNTTTGEGFYIAGAGDCTFKDSVVITKLDGPGMFFGGGNVLIDSASNLYFSGGIGGNAYFLKLTRLGTAPINIENGPDNLYLGPNNTFNSNFSYTGKTITLYNNTFQGSTTIKVNGNTTTSSYGGNVFNGTTLIQDSSSTAHSMYLATGAADDYNGDVTFVQKGTGVNLYPAYTKNSTFAKNITLEGTTSMQLGGNGGKVIIDGSTTQSITRGNTSLFPTIKKLQVNKATNSLTLNTPLTVSDSLQLTQGRINTDTTNLLTIAHGGKVTGGSDNNYINGPMKKIGNTVFSFPLGSSTLAHPYHPLEITSPTSTTDAYTASYFPTAQTIGTTIDTSIDNLNACQYWKLDRNTGTSKVRVKLGWNHDSCETISPTNFRVAGWNGTIWKDLGNSVTSGDSLQGMVQSNDSLNGISTLTLAFRKCSAFRKTLSQTNVSCKGGSDGMANIIVKGGTESYIYEWGKALSTDHVVKNLKAGAYSVSTSDIRGCNLLDSINITEPTEITVTLTSTPSTCQDSTGSISSFPSGGVGGFKYSWMAESDTTFHLVNRPAGEYTVMITDSNNCRVTKKGFIENTDGPGINVISQSDPTCFGATNGNVTICGSDSLSPYRYTWLTHFNDTSSTQSNLRAGLYPVKITNRIGCISIDTIEISEPDTFAVRLNLTATPCGSNSGQAIAIPKGGVLPLTYSWSNSSDTDSIVNGLASGVDTLIITDSSGCQIKRIFEIESSSGISLSGEVINNVKCFPDSGGKARVVVTGGTPPFHFVWSELNNDNDTASNLLPGTYTITVIDSNGCRAKTEINISGPNELRANMEFFNPTADSSFDGAIRAYPSGGVPPYEYHWSESGMRSSLENLGTGEYLSVIIDQNGCKVFSKIPLTVPSTICYGCSPIYIDGCYDPGLPTCSTCTTPVVIDITDFGADGSDDISDHCAFQQAAAYLALQNSAAEKTLNIPSGTYYVGYQEAIDGWYKGGSNALCFENIEHLSIIGDPGGVGGTKPVIKMDKCLEYGAFDVDVSSSTFGGRFLSNFSGIPVTVTIVGTTCTFSSPQYLEPGFQLVDPDPSHYFIDFGGRVRKWFDDTFIGQVNSSTEFTIMNAPNYYDPDLGPTYQLLLYTNCHVNPTGQLDYSNVAEVGDIIHLKGCNDVLIDNLELDGSIDNAVIGGGYIFDGIQVAYDGIFMNACDSTVISNCNIHHFGRDGIYMIYNSCLIPPVFETHNTHCSITNTKVNFSGRNGLSWGGGKGLEVRDSEFNLSGQSRLVSQPGAGLDIEFENSSNPNAYGYFKNTKFKFNKNHGMICDAASSIPLTDHIVRDHTFDQCTFVGSEYGEAAWPNSRNFDFNTQCNFYGIVQRPFTVVAQPTDLIFGDNTTFSVCYFNEEYTETDLTLPVECQGTHYFSFTPEETEFIGGVWQPVPSCDASMHRRLVDFPSANRVEMENCILTSNFCNNIVYLGTQGFGGQDYTRNRITNCLFNNYGQNYEIQNNGACACDPSLGSISNTNFYGTNEIHYSYPNPYPPTTCSSPWNYTFSVDNSLCGEFPETDYLGQVTGTIDPLNILAAQTVYFGKYKNIVDPNSAIPLYSNPCSAEIINYPTECSLYQRSRRRSTEVENETQLQLIVFPNPIHDVVTIENLSSGESLEISDLIGNIVFKKKMSQQKITLDLIHIQPGIYFLRTLNSLPIKIIKL